MRILTRSNRRGVECVEAALSLPLILLTVFPVIHITHRWHTEKMLKIAVYEGIQAGGKPNGTNEDAEKIFNEYAQAFGINGARLQIPSRVDFSKRRADQMIFARGYAPTKSNLLPVPLNLNFQTNIYSGWVYYRKEKSIDD